MSYSEIKNIMLVPLPTVKIYEYVAVQAHIHLLTICTMVLEGRMWVSGQIHISAALPAGKGPGTHWKKGLRLRLFVARNLQNINTLRGQNAESEVLKSGGRYSSHWALIG
jgi:hypothetical protein